MYDYAAVIHVHTNYSGDSEATVADIARLANRYGVDVVIITDHNTLAALPQEGWWGRTLVLVGEEITPEGGNHYLAFGLREAVSPAADCAEVIAAVRAQGGLGFLAHPFFGGNRHFGIPAAPWRNWKISGYTGLCLFDYANDGGERMRPWSYVLYTLFPWLDVDRPNPHTLRLWDRLTMRRPVVALGTVDAHLYRVRVGPFRFSVHPFSYFFRTVRTHLLLPVPLPPELEAAKGLVLDALAQGRAYVSNDYLGDPRGFCFAVRDRTGILGKIGDVVTWVPHLVLEVQVPRPGRIRLLRNGRPLYLVSGRRLSWPVAVPGVYRVEVERHHALRWKPWIFSNPIYLLPARAFPGSRRNRRKGDQGGGT